MQKTAITRILACGLWIAGNVLFIGLALADDPHGHGQKGLSHGGMIKERHMSAYGKWRGHHRPVSPLAMKEKLGLSEEQVKTLEPLESDYRKASIKNRADLKIAMIDLGDLLDQATPDKNAISQKIDDIGDIQKTMMVYRVETLLKLKDVLTPEQYGKFRAVLKNHMEHRMGARKHAMSEMMHRGSEGDRSYEHGKTDD